MTKPGTLLTLGHGYCASALTRDLVGAGWRVLGTVRDANKGHALMDQGVEPILWTPKTVARALEQASHVLVSAGPEVEPKVGHKAGGAMGHDPSLALISDVLTRRAQDLRWVGYLSTTGVYGDANGDWVTESSPLHPGTKRGQARLAAETDWRAIPDLPLHIFRLAGIYGPGRGPFAKVRAGTARRIIKPGQVFSRIHVADIAQVLRASMARSNPGAAYNVCDDDPAPPQ
ncbi:MAG: SDR family oxidoreductase, partial [Primorskyibacter sp.]